MEMTEGPSTAYASIRGNSNHPDLKGTVRFVSSGNGTLVIVDVKGLPDSKDGFFGLHIHEGDSCDGVGFPNTGGHYNPENAPHPRHGGDLPPLLNSGGKAYLAILTDRFQIKDIIGRSVIIHSDPDDFKTQPSGASGTKIACGVICRAW